MCRECAVSWCGVVCYDVVWCGVVWCGRCMCNVCTGVQETKEGRSSNESLFREEDHEMRAISSKSKSSAINIIY